MIDEDGLTPLELSWSKAMSKTARSECPSAEVLLEVSDRGKRSRHFTACMNHLADCSRCTQLMLELREATELSRGATKSRTKLVVVVGGGLALAASVVFGLFFAGQLPGGAGPGGTTQGALANMVALARTNGALDVPAGLQAFDASLGVNRGDGEVPELVSPVATWVDSKDVPLDWKPVKDAQGYEVLLQPEGSQLKRIAAGTSVQVSSGGLDRGVTYHWQVVARVGGDERSSPEAAFRVLSLAESSQLAGLAKSSSDDPIALAALYGHYGLLELADKELKRAASGADADLSARIQEDLEKRRFKAPAR